MILKVLKISSDSQMFLQEPYAVKNCSSRNIGRCVRTTADIRTADLRIQFLGDGLPSV